MAEQLSRTRAAYQGQDIEYACEKPVDRANSRFYSPFNRRRLRREKNIVSVSTK